MLAFNDDGHPRIRIPEGQPWEIRQNVGLASLLLTHVRMTHADIGASSLKDSCDA